MSSSKRSSSVMAWLIPTGLVAFAAICAYFTAKSLASSSSSKKKKKTRKPKQNSTPAAASASASDVVVAPEEAALSAVEQVVVDRKLVEELLREKLDTVDMADFENPAFLTSKDLAVVVQSILDAVKNAEQLLPGTRFDAAYLLYVYSVMRLLFAQSSQGLDPELVSQSRTYNAAVAELLKFPGELLDSQEKYERYMSLKLDMCQQSGDFEEGSAILKEALKRAPDNHQLLMTCLAFSSHLGEFDTFLDLCAALVEKNPQGLDDTRLIAIQNPSVPDYKTLRGIIANNIGLLREKSTDLVLQRRQFKVTSFRKKFKSVDGDDSAQVELLRQQHAGEHSEFREEPHHGSMLIQIGALAQASIFSATVPLPLPQPFIGYLVGNQIRMQRVTEQEPISITEEIVLNKEANGNLWTGKVSLLQTNIGGTSESTVGVELVYDAEVNLVDEPFFQ